MYFPMATIGRIYREDKPINYTGIEFKQPIEDFTPASIFEYYSERSDEFFPYLVHAETEAICDKCDGVGATEYDFEIVDEQLADSVTDSSLLCRSCRKEFEESDHIKIK